MERLGDSVSNTTAKMKNDDKQLRTALHRLDELEAVSAKLRKRSMEIEAALSERTHPNAAGAVPEMTFRQQHDGCDEPASRTKTKPLDSVKTTQSWVGTARTGRNLHVGQNWVGTPSHLVWEQLQVRPRASMNEFLLEVGKC